MYLYLEQLRERLGSAPTQIGLDAMGSFLESRGRLVQHFSERPFARARATLESLTDTGPAHLNHEHSSRSHTNR